MFIKLAAASCDSRCADILFGAGFSGRVHSVFERTLNIADRDNTLYSLVRDTADDAPHSVRVQLPPGFRFDAAGVSPGVPVRADGVTLIVGNELLVDAAGIMGWDEPLPHFPAGGRIAALAANLAVLRQVIAAAGHAGGVKAAGSPSGIFAGEMAERTEALLAALATADMAAMEVQGRRLLGFGVGQTPAGDDFLSGLLLVINMPDAPFSREYVQWGDRLATEAGGLTNDISRALLCQAAAGRARSSVVALLRALAAGDGGAVAAAAVRVLAIGSTSGTDIAAGIAAGMQQALDRVEDDKGRQLWQ